MNHSRKSKKAYSLVEVVVSLGIIGVVMTMLFTTLILSLEITFKVLARSVVREEVSNVTSQITRDIRNADLLIECGGSSAQNKCSLVLNGIQYEWSLCGDRICKDQIVSGSRSNVYTSTRNIKYKTFIFDKGFNDSNNVARQNILITVVGSHTNESFNVNNVIKQTSVSTRNYEL